MLARRPRCSASRTEHVVVIDADAIPEDAPVKRGDQVKAYQFIRNADGGEDAGLPLNAVAVFLLDRATAWIAVYPKASITAEHTIEALKHRVGPTDKIASFYCDNALELVAAARARRC